MTKRFAAPFTIAVVLAVLAIAPISVQAQEDGRYRIGETVVEIEPGSTTYGLVHTYYPDYHSRWLQVAEDLAAANPRAFRNGDPGAMIVGRCLSVQAARTSVDWQVLLVIAAAIALGGALEKTGAAQTIAETLIGLGADSPTATLVLLFCLAAGFSAIISNLAAAVLLFPVALSASLQLGVDVKPFAVTLMIAASTCFATPIGYQTNLMVYGPGGYRFADFMKIGVPLTLVVGVVTALVVPEVWPV